MEKLTNKRQARTIKFAAAERLVGLIPFGDHGNYLILTSDGNFKFMSEVIDVSQQTPLMRALLPAYARLHEILHAEAMRLVRRK